MQDTQYYFDIGWPLNAFSRSLLGNIWNYTQREHCTAILWKKTKPPVFPQRLSSTSYLSCQHCSVDARAGRWRRIWRSESRPLKTNATGECLAYHTESINQANICSNGSISSQDVMWFYSQPSSVASYHCSAMSVVLIRCRRSYYKEQWVAIVAEEDLVNHGRTTSRNAMLPAVFIIRQNAKGVLPLCDDRRTPASLVQSEAVVYLENGLT